MIRNLAQEKVEKEFKKLYKVIEHRIAIDCLSIPVRVKALCQSVYN